VMIAKSGDRLIDEEAVGMMRSELMRQAFVVTPNIPEAETLAGLIYETLKRVPEEEEQMEVEGLRIIIKKMKGPKIVLAKVLKVD